MINTKDFDWESELASEVIDIIFNREAGWTEKLDDTIAIYRKKAIQADRQQLLKAVEEKIAALHNSEQDGEIPNAKIEVFREVIDLLKAKDYMEGL